MNLCGIEVGRIGLGTNRLMRTSANITFIRAAVDAGVRLIDTAHVYTTGESELAIGEALSSSRISSVIATKGGWGGPGHGRAEHLNREIVESLQRLGRQTISLYYLHRIDPETPIEESLSVIKDNCDRGRIQAVGLSEVDIADIERARRVLRIAAVQNRYNLSERGYDDVVDYCAREGIAFVPFYPLRGGVGGVLQEIARKHRVTPQQISLAWLLERSSAILPIPGTLSMEHLRQNLAAAQIRLTKAEYKTLLRLA